MPDEDVFKGAAQIAANGVFIEFEQRRGCD
jgi:hypothetical protein